MESSGAAAFMRYRKFESYSDTNSTPHVQETWEFAAREEPERKLQADDYEDDDGWYSVLVSCFRIAACFVTMMVTTAIWVVVMVLLLPWPNERIRQGNVYGHLTGRMLMWILGNPVKIEGIENANERAIYICNHTSPIDIFLTMWLTPTGTVGIAKKEIIWYPLIGQLYVLANHLRIDRSNPTAAVRSLKDVAKSVVNNKLSLIIFPEGTRSKNGRLLPFKKGFAHLALQTRLPVVPIVLTGAHLAWRKGSLMVRPQPISVKFLSPIITEGWTEDKIDDYVKLVHGIYVKNLPNSQKPVDEVVSIRLTNQN